MATFITAAVRTSNPTTMIMTTILIIVTLELRDLIPRVSMKAVKYSCLKSNYAASLCRLVLLEKLPVTHLNKNFPNSMKTLTFISVFTIVNQRFIS
jgi:hypothetical protein